MVLKMIFQLPPKDGRYSNSHLLPPPGVASSRDRQQMGCCCFRPSVIIIACLFIIVLALGVLVKEILIDHQKILEKERELTIQQQEQEREVVIEKHIVTNNNTYTYMYSNDTLLMELRRELPHRFTLEMQGTQRYLLPIRKTHGTFTIYVEHESDEFAPSAIYMAAGSAQSKRVECSPCSRDEDNAPFINVQWDRTSDRVFISKSKPLYDGVYYITIIENRVSIVA
jgi:hypothetical protein